MAETRCENARDIIDKYLKRSLESLGESGRADVRLKIYHDIAKFADAEYKQVRYVNLYHVLLHFAVDSR